MILPIAKLGTLALKSICKPIGKRIKKEAGLHPQFRHLIINLAQANHRLTTRVQRQIYGRATDVAIRPLNEEKAVQAAADLLGELFVFTVAGVAVILEVQRSARSEARKEELRRRELQAMKQRDDDLSSKVDVLKHRIEELEQLVKGQGHGIFSFQQTIALKVTGKVKTRFVKHKAIVVNYFWRGARFCFNPLESNRE